MRIHNVMMLVYAGVGSYTVYRCVKKLAQSKAHWFKQYVRLDKTGKQTMTVNDIAYRKVGEMFHVAAMAALGKLSSPSSFILKIKV